MTSLRDAVRHWPLYPVLVVTAFIAHGATADAIPIAWSWRAILAATIGTSFVLVLFSVLLGGVQRGSIATVVIAFWFLGEPAIAVTLLLATLVIAVAGVVGRIYRHPVSLGDPLARFANLASVALAALTIVTILVAELGGRPAAALGAGGDGPDIFVILLDGYPRADTLAEQYDFDNSSFLAELETLGFDVAELSESNYNMTVLTLVSMLEMRHVDDIGGLNRRDDSSQQWQDLADIMSQPEAVLQLRKLGYGVKMIASQFPNFGIRTADQYVDSGQLNSFEIAKLVRASAHGPLGRFAADFLAEQHRSRIIAAFDVLAADLPTDDPRLVFAHLLTPHTPFVFGAGGEELALQACFPSSCGFWDGLKSQLKRADFAEAARGQISYINGRVLAAVDALLAHAKHPPVIVIFSDHGSRLNPNDPREMLRNLFAAYTPGHPGMFGDDAMPVTVFPRLLRAYLGLEVPEPDRRQFILPMRESETPLDYSPYPPD
jgi:hypothetical protein